MVQVDARVDREGKIEVVERSPGAEHDIADAFDVRVAGVEREDPLMPGRPRRGRGSEPVASDPDRYAGTVMRRRRHGDAVDHEVTVVMHIVTPPEPPEQLRTLVEDLAPESSIVQFPKGRELTAAIAAGPEAQRQSTATEPIKR